MSLCLFIVMRVYNPESPDKGVAEIILAKQRNGPVGRVKLTFLGEFTKFENYANPVGVTNTRLMRPLKALINL